MIEDVELLRRYADGHANEAFAELVQRRIGLVYAVALRHTNHAQLAEEVTQSVFTDLARKARVLSQRPTLIGWLHRSAQFAASDAVRSERRRKQREQESHAMQQIEREGQEPHWESNRPLLDELLAAMGEGDRDALMLRYYEGLGFAEIGDRLRLNENTARMRTERALERLRSALTRRGVTSTAMVLAMGLAESTAGAVPAQFAGAVSATAVAEAANLGTVAGIIVLMSTPKIITGAAALIALASLGVAVFEAQQEHQTDNEIAALRNERDLLRGQLASSRTPSTAPKASPAGTGDPAGVPSFSSSPADEFRRKADATWGPDSPITIALSSPEARAAFIDQEVLRTKLKFARFFSETGLSTAQQEAFLAQVKTMAQDMLALHEAFLARGVGPLNPPQDPALLFEFLSGEDKVLFDYEEGMRSSVGDAISRQVDSYVRTIPDWTTVENLATRLTATDSPLTTAQARELVRLLQDNPPRPGSPPSPENTLNGRYIPEAKLGPGILNPMRITGAIVFPNRLTGESLATDAAIARTAGLLSGPQLAALRELQSSQADRLILAPEEKTGATMEQAQEFYQKLQKAR